MNRAPTFFARLTPVWAVLLLFGCGTTHRLHDYTFDDATVAVVANIPPRPVVFTDLLFDAYLHPDDPIGSVFRAGSAIAKQAEARAAQTRMDSALAYVDVADRVARRALAQSAQTLGYRPTAHVNDADFLLDLHIADYGLVADSWQAEVHFEVDAEMLLIDRRTRKAIWKRRIREAEPVSQAGVGLGATFGNVYTAVALSHLSVEEMARALEDLADFTADRLAAALRHDFYASR